MWTVLAILGVLIVGVILLLRSDFGKDVRAKTDQQLYRRYNAYLRHWNIARTVDVNSRTQAQEELARMREEFERRGYDLDKLFAEEANAKWEGRSMDFSRGRREK